MSTKENNGSQDRLQFDEALCERYLFGELTEPEQERFEEAYFDDDVFFDRFIAVKTELLDLYSRGELDPAKRTRMEPHFLATAPRRRRLSESSEFISAVNAISYRDNRPRAAVVMTAEPSFFDSLARFFTLPRLVGTAALLIAAIGGTYLISRRGQDGATDAQFARQPRSGETPAVDPRPSTSPDRGSQSPGPDVTGNPTDPKDTAAPRGPVRPKSEIAARPKMKRPTPLPRNEIRSAPDRKSVASDPLDHDQNMIEITIPEPSVTLRAGATRDIGAGNTLTIPAGARSATLTLFFTSERHLNYFVTIMNVEGTKVFRTLLYDNRFVSDMKDGSKRLTAVLEDTSGMGEKDYIVKLEGHFPRETPETIEEYYFRVRRPKKALTAGDPPEEPKKKPWQ